MMVSTPTPWPNLPCLEGLKFTAKPYPVAKVNAFDFDVSPRLDDVTKYTRVTSSELPPLFLNKFQNPFKKLSC